jgi:hypothetical protein
LLRAEGEQCKARDQAKRCEPLVFGGQAFLHKYLLMLKKPVASISAPGRQKQAPAGGLAHRPRICDASISRKVVHAFAAARVGRDFPVRKSCPPALTQAGTDVAQPLFRNQTMLNTNVLVNSMCCPSRLQRL